MYGLLLPLDIKGLSTREIRIQLFRSKLQKSTEFNFLFLSNSSSICSCLFMERIERKLNKRNSKRFSNRDYSLPETDPSTLP